ncbi:hypothetical protein EVAR_25007_1 [Eumeta japonica]|uniref:Uncharacterized protein n=1 Tax=Eumeta variegata TaxID=151549 RepID=A0A4C1XG35_EUMVA|nr:hypothetical protein EVAR_25007_1 [Eumeta japonica]
MYAIRKLLNFTFHPYVGSSGKILQYEWSHICFFHETMMARECFITPVDGSHGDNKFTIAFGRRGGGARGAVTGGVRFGRRKSRVHYKGPLLRSDAINMRRGRVPFSVATHTTERSYISTH